MNKKLKSILKNKKISTYGLADVLNISPQAAEYVVKKKDLTADYKRLKSIAEYCGCSIEDIID